MSRQSDQFSATNPISYVADFPGADPANDTIHVDVGDASVGIDSAVTVDQIEQAIEVASISELVSVQEDSPLDVSATTVPVEHQGVIDVSDRDDRTLGDVDITQLPDADRQDWNSVTLAADSSLEHTMAAVGADRLRGRVSSSGSYDVQVSWLAEDGTELFVDEIASGVAGGTATDIDLIAIGPEATVSVVDTSSAEQTVSGVLHLA